MFSVYFREKKSFNSLTAIAIGSFFFSIDSKLITDNNKMLL